MVDSQRMLTKPEVYEGLIDRLGRALDVARTAARLRDERPEELELRGLSPAEFEVIKAYLDLSERTAPQWVAPPPASEPARSAKVVWLKDLSAGRGPEKLRSVRFK
ncbi:MULTISPECIES: hypothetical protein [unclassified Pseudomonas]|uniref:hypothetical protein n=1 Tax=unclassified Pseudomonas TaxID=196821 RepID=UPI0011EBED7E|nr:MULTISPECIES: hypothetical protein [unclassified Pseudomonas]KAA0942456.1 hypothetical protein FQ182_27440 [Pseudomonas sp. ANT_H4]KAA0947630.1 hypothetical protein FQ186_24880 [Pseudomonas sp. ANT_H14]